MVPYSGRQRESSEEEGRLSKRRRWGRVNSGCASRCRRRRKRAWARSREERVHLSKPKTSWALGWRKKRKPAQLRKKRKEEGGAKEKHIHGVLTLGLLAGLCSPCPWSNHPFPQFFDQNKIVICSKFSKIQKEESKSKHVQGIFMNKC